MDPPSSYPRPGGPPAFQADKVIGGIIIGLSTLGLIFILLASLFVGAVASDMVKESAPPLGMDGLNAAKPMVAAIGIGLVVTVVGIGLHIVSGVAIFRGKRAGFILALVLSALALLSGGIGLVMAVGVGLYSILRLWGNVGPRPT